jgi:CRISPR/Cas system CSM-associated protein Csm3 (group 7 of RAMP superfamily)
LLPEGTRFAGQLYVLMEDNSLGWAFGHPRPLPGDPDKWLAADWEPQRVRKELLLDRLQGVIYLGGHKSKGMGRVRISIGEAAGA